MAMVQITQEITLRKGREGIRLLICSSENTIVNVFHGHGEENYFQWNLTSETQFDKHWLDNGCLHFIIANVALRLREGYNLSGNMLSVLGDNIDGLDPQQDSPSSLYYEPRVLKNQDETKRDQKGRTDILELAPYFYYPINEAAKRLHICPTVLKKICRKHGLRRWPHRKLQSIERSLSKLRQAMDDCSHDSSHLYSIASRIKDLEEEKKALCFM